MNPVELNIFASRLGAVCELMGVVLQRAAFSPNIKDRQDYSCALFDKCGGLLAQAAHIPVHLGSMAYAMSGVVERFQWSEGDVVVFNDPFLGGTHLPDVTIVSPVFYDGDLLGFVANRAHHANIGAAAPGSMPVSSLMEEEGVMISPQLLYASGNVVQNTFDLLLSVEGSLESASTSKDLPGDFAAQVSANQNGVKRLVELLVDWGREYFLAGVHALNEYAEAIARSAIASLPDGCYTYRDVMDSDGFGAVNLPVVVSITISGSDVDVDFSGSADQVVGNINCPISVAAAAVYYVFYCLLPKQVPACAGTFRFLSLHAPSRTIINAEGPAAVAAGNVETSMRIVDVTLGALAKAIPEIMPADSQGTMNNVAMGSSVSGKSWDYYETLAGGHGGSAHGSGLHATQAHMTNTLNTPVESLEMHYPLQILRYEIRKGSGGRGVYCGGDGVVRSYRFLDGASLSLLTERRQSQPKGRCGGEDGLSGVNLLNLDELADKAQLTVSKGDILTVKTPGGGGWGMCK